MYKLTKILTVTLLCSKIQIPLRKRTEVHQAEHQERQNRSREAHLQHTHSTCDWRMQVHFRDFQLPLSKLTGTVSNGKYYLMQLPCLGVTEMRKTLLNSVLVFEKPYPLAQSCE